MVALLGRRRLEAEDLCALRVDARQDVTNGAILAGGVQGLDDDEQGKIVLRVEPLLHPGQLELALREHRLSLALVSRASSPVRGVVPQPYPSSNRHAEAWRDLPERLHK